MLLKNVHLGLKAPTASGKSFVIKDDYFYYHYGCDGQIKDHGWGCAYRTLQTMCSWILMKRQGVHENVPSILDIQRILAEIDSEKPANFVGTHSWIGAMEVFYVLDKLFDAKCRILHKPEGAKFTPNDIEKLLKYFENFAGICMMGGNTDAASKGIAGIHVDEISGVDDDGVYLLVIDPHFPRRPRNAEELIEAGYVSWQPLKNFAKASFYNVCMPEIK